MDIAFICLIAAAFITGLSKFSVGGMGVIIIPILMLAYPGTEALGIILPLYIITDIMAAAMYRKRIHWGVLKRLLPLGLIGMAIGFFSLSTISPEQFSTLVGSIIVFMIAAGVFLDIRASNKNNSTLMQSPMMSHVIGLITGFLSMVSNGAGPILGLYLLDQKLDKEQLIHTRVWTVFILNIIKIPILYTLGVFHQTSLFISLQALPVLVIGIVCGYVLLKFIKLTQLKWIIRVIALAAAIKLLVIG